MYLEINNEAPIQRSNDGKVVPLGTGPAKTVFRFPDGIELMQAIAIAREAIPWHVADEKVSGFKSDDPDLEHFMNRLYGLKDRAGKSPPGAAGLLGAATVLMLAYAMTRFQLRTNYGTGWQAGIMGGASNGSGLYAPATFMAVSSNSVAPVVTDTTLVGEITAGTLSRALATYGYTSPAATYTESNVFTSDQTVTIYKSGLFIASAPGTGSPVFASLLYLSGVPTPKSLNSGDEVGITTSISY